MVQVRLLLAAVLAVVSAQQIACEAIFPEQKPVLPNDSDYKFNFTAATPPGSAVIVKIGSSPFSKSSLQLRQVFVEPCGVLAAHIHPHATEFAFVIKGAVQYGMYLEDGTQKYINVTTGEATLVPQGTVHFVYNLVCCQSALTIAFDDPNPGGIYVGAALTAFPAYYKQSAFASGLNDSITGNTFFTKDCSCPPNKKKKCPDFP